MTLGLPANLENGHTAEWVTLHLAIGLYVSREATLGQAAEVAKLSQVEFRRELGKRKIALNYSLDDLKTDLAAVRELAAR